MIEFTKEELEWLDWILDLLIVGDYGLNEIQREKENIDFIKSIKSKIKDKNEYSTQS